LLKEVLQVSERSNDNLSQELTKLYNQLSALRTETEEFYKRALDWKAKRDELNKMMGQLASKLKQEREHRNRANEKVAELKVMKEEFKKELDERKNLIDELERKKRETISHLRDDPDQLRERIRKLDWFLQTNVLSLGRENELVKEVSALEKRLKGVNVIDKVDTELSETVDKANGIKGKLYEYRTRMLEQVKMSQEHHAVVVDLKKQLGDLKKEADNAHERYLESFGFASESLSKSRKIHDQIRELNARLMSERTERKPDIEIDMKQRVEKVVTQAYEKVKKGGKITMDELSVLVDKGFFSDSGRS
jgi:phosphoserine phosphatase